MYVAYEQGSAAIAVQWHSQDRRGAGTLRELREVNVTLKGTRFAHYVLLLSPAQHWAGIPGAQGRKQVQHSCHWLIIMRFRHGNEIRP